MAAFLSSPLLYSLVIFISAFQLFQLQPMIAKMILPYFGGAAAVWITCMLFFQTVLLAGYVYAHLLINRLKPAAQTAIHLLLLALSLVTLPVAVRTSSVVIATDSPAGNIIGILLFSVGLPYFLLSTTSPLLQAWFSRTHSTALPYRLFSLSNLASLAGLVAYPFIIEPALTLPSQSMTWSFLYGAYVVLCALLGIGTLRSARKPAGKTEQTGESAADLSAPPPPLLDRTLWLLLSLCSSVLLLAATNFITQNVAAIPFLWIIPLCIYLMTFIVSYYSLRWYNRTVITVVTALLACLMVYLFFYYEIGHFRLVIGSYCGGLLACFLFCHGELSIRKPHAAYLTGYYLVISLGGAIGGIMIAIVAPSLFNSCFELLVGFLLLGVLLFLANLKSSLPAKAISAVLVVFFVFALVRYKGIYAAKSIYMTRNFYGSLRVQEYNPMTPSAYRTMMHGSVVHGAQYLAPWSRPMPVTYYSATGGFGRTVQSLSGRQALRAGVIGLGVGSVAAYGRPGDEYRFYEINPLVETAARKYFYYLNDSRAKTSVVIGDGRLMLEKETDAVFDILVLDAFSGDSIPVHLLTLEAFQMYLRKLKPDGVLAVHISNSHLDLSINIKRLAAKLNKNYYLVKDFRGYTTVETEKSIVKYMNKPQREPEDSMIIFSEWMLLSSDPHFLSELGHGEKLPDAPRSYRDVERVWTDSYSNLFEILN